ncbi:hypothetical protein PLICRDRAFT_115334 [Plicaturopsis crispa FD-325 SS-3]|nr:hypothetical protein PLICRDRAFT_115334 [Plicaturopsis crispa FD-325 SS-3]
MAQSNTFFPPIGSVVSQAGQPASSEAIEGEDDEKLLQEIESLCMKCHEQGVTRMLLTSIPFFREVIVMSFRCEHCGATNNEIQSAGTIRPEGTIYTARILSRDDLNRQLVRSSTCTILIPELELTLPATRGQLTTVEGLVRDIATDLSTDQPLRRIQDEVSYTKIQALISKLKAILGDPEDDYDAEATTKESREQLPMPAFTVKLDDPAGNSFIEFIGSMADPKWNMRTYPRTRQQNVDLGLIAEDAETVEPPNEAVSIPASTGVAAVDAALSTAGTDEEIFIFPGICSSCGQPLNTMMKKVVIPYFKDIIIMSTNCDRCGYRDNEVKSGSAISPQGKRITLKVEDRDDLSRDILKSETSGLTIPEIDLVLQPGTLGGRFTTLEGILNQVHEELSEKVFSDGDSSTVGAEGRTAFTKFLKSLKEVSYYAYTLRVKNAERPFTLILDDPLANSYIQNIYAPDPDPNMEIEIYDRTWQQNEDLGLNDMKVEGYEEVDKSEGSTSPSS